jgi:nitrite reductase/ring-hydroxylating ferredoxin subunit
VPIHRVCPIGDLRDSAPIRVVLEGQAVCLTKIGDQPHAISDVCPHNGASLSDGVVKDGCVTCPSHLWRFSFLDGEKQGNPDVRVRVYGTTTTDDGWVEVDVPVRAPERSLREILLAHAHGEQV